MTDDPKNSFDLNQPTVYHIRLKGYLSQARMNWFEGLTITLEADGNTLLQGLVVDQSALHGLLKKIRDLGMPLISVISIAPNQAVNTEETMDNL